MSLSESRARSAWLLVFAAWCGASATAQDVVYDPVADISDWFAGVPGRTNLPSPWEVIVNSPGFTKTPAESTGFSHAGPTGGPNGLFLWNAASLSGPDFGFIGVARFDGHPDQDNGWLQPGGMGGHGVAGLRFTAPTDGTLQIDASMFQAEVSSDNRFQRLQIFHETGPPGDRVASDIFNQAIPQNPDGSPREGPSNTVDASLSRSVVMGDFIDILIPGTDDPDDPFTGLPISPPPGFETAPHFFGLEMQITGQGFGSDFQWSSTGTSNWLNDGNWDLAKAPNSNVHGAIFGDAIGTNDRTVTVDSDDSITVKNIDFNNTMGGSYSVSGSGALSLSTDDSNNPTIDAMAGRHEIEVELNLTAPTNILASGSGAVLDINDTVATNGNALNITNGSGQINVNNTVSGGGEVSVSASATLGTAGSTTIEGNLTSSGTLDIDAGDLFQVGGLANLSGTLDIDVGGVAPGGPLTVLSASGGISEDLILGGPDAGLFTGISVQGTNLVLTSDGVPGDYNGDGVVNTLDYALIRNNLGSDTPLANDGGLGTPIGPDHYDLWKASFGLPAASGTAAAVPEPASLLLLAIATLSLAVAGRTGRSS